MSAFEGRPAIEDALSTAIREGLSAGCTEVEAFASSVRVKQVLAEHGTCSSSRLSLEYGVFVRAAVGKRVGVSFVNSLALPDVRDCSRQAARTASLRPEDASWGGFPAARGKSSSVKGILDASVENLEMSDLVESCETLIGASADFHRSVTAASAAVEVRDTSRGVENTSGVSVFSRDAMLSAHCYCVSGKGSRVTPECGEGGASRRTDMDFESLGESAAEIAVLSSRRAQPSAGEFDIVFSPFALGYADGGLVRSILGSALSGESVARGKSFFAGRVGDRVSSDILTVRDNPRAAGRCGSRPFDDEGVPTDRTELIESGVLRGFMWDSSSASIGGTRSTGNARRDPWSGALAVKPNNMEVVPSKLSWRELCEDVRRGYLVWACQGGHTSNMETGNFSFVASPGLMIQDGEIVGGVRGTMVSGNMVELLGKVDLVGGDVRDLGDCLMPSMRFRDVRVYTG